MIPSGAGIQETYAGNFRWLLRFGERAKREEPRAVR
jgi:hypothetical protein